MQAGSDLKGAAKDVAGDAKSAAKDVSYCYSGHVPVCTAASVLRTALVTLGYAAGPATSPSTAQEVVRVLLDPVLMLTRPVRDVLVSVKPLRSLSGMYGYIITVPC